jgi:DNA-binding transcriptional ArsR family regulator
MAPSSVFHALSDPTRCAVIRALGRGPSAVSALAQPFNMALPSFMKHVSVLERSGMIRTHKEGRVRTCELVPSSLASAERWLVEQREQWHARTDRMTKFVEDLHQKEKSHGQRRARRD